MAAYFVMFAAAVLVAGVFFAKRAPDIIGMSAEDRIAWLDVFTFLLIALAYLLVMYGLGVLALQLPDVVAGIDQTDKG